ncbi:MAG TPA: trypsin-like peptidase domain-containing protein [Tepidisphaeraceae bacterium]|jgi:serine protease Do|nr:trypsin-like peptidase domain-containing protein [Tepidisphaeraceae bacterium]
MRLSLTLFTLLFSASALAEAPEPINLRHTVTVEVVQRTKDAIVNVSTSSLAVRRVVQRFGPSPFQDMFGSQLMQVPVNSLGSGFIIHADGYVVTNNHVIDRAREITVELADGRKMKADLVSADPDADLAVLHIHADKPLPVLQLGESDSLMIGEPAIAVGNPLGFSHSVSTGIVSALHRNLKGDQEKTILADLIQTDAAINPGNSGGPLLNAYGQVIGINTAIRGDAQNIGFAIPINKLRDLIPELMNPAPAIKLSVAGKFTESRQVTPPSTIHAEVHLEGHESSPVTTIDGHPITNIVDAYAALLNITPEQKEVTVHFADSTEEHLAVRAVPLPDAIVQAKKQLGLTLEQVTPMLAEQVGLKTEQGLLVTEVKRSSIADRADLKPGDVVVALGRYPIKTLNDFANLLPHLPKSGQVSIGVLRGDQIGYGVLKF